MESNDDLFQIIASLPAEAKTIIGSLHETALTLGYQPKISPAGKKPDHWKCEYTAAKPKRVLYTLRITGQRFTIRAKLFYLPEYIDLLENCGRDCKASLLSASKNCGNHRGSCAGPIVFIVDGESYTKCRRYFLWKDIKAEDAKVIGQLLQNEARHAANI